MPTRLVARVCAAFAAVTAVAAPIAILSAPGGQSTAVAPKAARAVPVTQVAPEPVPARRVVLYGDSLAWESRDFFTAALAGASITQVTTRTFGGTAICDWLDQMRADAAFLRPDAVVVEFSGNALTPCMRAPDGSALTGATYFQKYANDAAAVLDIFTPHTLVYFVGAPISLSAEWTGDRTALTLHALYAALAQSSPYGRYTDAGAAVLAGGRWTATLPCLPTEPCTGGRDATGTSVNVVRAPDGLHFCPTDGPAVRGVTSACSVWASGSWRFGNAMAAPVIAEFDQRGR